MAIRLTRIYTRTGDKGDTALVRVKHGPLTQYVPLRIRS